MNRSNEPGMHFAGLHWFRSKQRALARVVLALFCLTWLQLAAMPCVMALDAASGGAAKVAAAGDGQQAAAMPDGMVMAPGEHCPYCPPEASQAGSNDSPAVCAFPHDPQVDARAGFAAALMAPPPSLVFVVPVDHAAGGVTLTVALAPAPAPSTSLAVSFCRFLK
jgi:hypothetical protein